MADESQSDGQERTEQPSERRQAELRAEGQIARSVEVSAFFGIIAALMGLSFFGPDLFRAGLRAMQSALRVHEMDGIGSALPWLQWYVLPILHLVLGLVGVLFAMSLCANLMQTGLVFSWKVLRAHPEMVNPMSGLKRMCSPRMWVQLFKNLLKVGCIGWIAWGVLGEHLDELTGLAALPFTTGMAWSGQLIARLVVRIAIFLFVIAAADYGYQWWTLRKKSMMSRHEIKEEMKQQEMSGQVKSRLRQFANTMVKNAVRKEVPQADVVVTNPTHYAVALKYDRIKDRAPRVVAKGKDLIAAFIREVATEHQVPLYEYPELARSLHKRVKVGQLIPTELFEAVARVLAFIYQVQRRRPRRWV